MTVPQYKITTCDLEARGEYQVLERELKGRLDVHESAIVKILERVFSILNPPRLPVPKRRRIGFRVEEGRPAYGTSRQGRRRRK